MEKSLEILCDGGLRKLYAQTLTYMHTFTIPFVLPVFTPSTFLPFPFRIDVMVSWWESGEREEREREKEREKEIEKMERRKMFIFYNNNE